MKKTEIILQEINHQKYSSLVEHFKKYTSLEAEGSNKYIPLINIKKIGDINGNPPTYHQMEIEVSTDVKTEIEKIKVSEAMKGLVDILLALE
ncbi:MAG: hypothetical protein Q8O84_02455 [Nanoarchaeota archaeon]|nr:hypothetical protein [Nanoarchaeota archaeon]